MAVRIHVGDARATLAEMPTGFVDCVVTSPPYMGMRTYGGGVKEIGRQGSIKEYVAALVEVFREVRRVLKQEGTVFVNIGDGYVGSGMGAGGQGTGVAHDQYYWSAGSAKQRTNVGGSSNPPVRPSDAPPAKNLMLVPARFALALQNDGWWVRSQIIWAKPNAFPESAPGRPTVAHEHVWMLTKAPNAYWNEVPTGGRRLRNYEPEPLKVWRINVVGFEGEHYATFPPELVKRCLEVGCPPGGTVLDPFAGSGTTGLVADQLGYEAVLCELNPEYARLALERIRGETPMFTQASMFEGGGEQETETSTP